MSEVQSEDARDVLAALAGRDDPTRRAEGHAAFSRVYQRHSGVVWALCRGELGNQVEADDALQETFIRAYRKLHDVTDGAGVRGWLYAIARHVCSERRRASGRRTAHEAAAGERTQMNGRAHVIMSGERSDGPASLASGAESLRQLSNAMTMLSDDERLALHLYYADADPVQAAKEALGLSRSGFYKLLARARERLEEKMGGGGRWTAAESVHGPA